MVPVILAALLLAATTVSAAAPQAADSARAAPRIVRVLAVEGVPTDTLVHAEFMLGFDEGLAAPVLRIERADDLGGWRAADSLRNRFRRTADPAAEHVWTVQVVVGAPPPYAVSRRNSATKKSERHIDPNLRASRGMTLTVFALSPEAIDSGVRAMPQHMDFAFPAGAAPASVLRAVAGGFDFPWREAGRVSATLALELLHHHSGDLPGNARCNLSPVLRAVSVR